MKRQELLLWPKRTGGILRALGLQFNTWPVLGTGVKDPALLQLQLGSRLRVRSDHAVGRPKTKKKKKMHIFFDPIIQLLLFLVYLINLPPFCYS